MGSRKLGRRTDHRAAMLRSLVQGLLEHERIQTTEARAKEVRSVSERLISLAKRGDLHSKRQAASYLQDEKSVRKLFDTIGPRYSERTGGYTRILKLGPRRGDGAPVVLMELVEE
jgi:large subunit ribosomal protein L17